MFRRPIERHLLQLLEMSLYSKIAKGVDCECSTIEKEVCDIVHIFIS